MTQPNDTIVRDLIADLRLSDEQTGGQPILSPDRVGTARAYLQQLLVDATDRLQQHIATLERLYRAHFVAPLPRSWRQGGTPPVQPPAAGFRHSAVLEEPLALAVLEGGVERLPADDLARLLLNPHALWDLADLVNTLLPAYWLDRMEEQGLQLAQDSGIDLYEGFEAVVGSAVPQDVQSRLAAAVRAEKAGLAAGNAVSQTPPPIRETEFLAVDTTNEAEIKRRFNGFVRSLHSYLNQLPCLRDLQKARRRWKARTAETDAFGAFATDPGHWYTFNHGGRNEAQFNVGLWPSYLRVGLGFEFTRKKGGDPTAVQLAYTCFRKVVSANRSQFEHFVADDQLEIEWADNKGGSLQFVPTGDVVGWLLNPLNPPQEPAWLFIGRLLRRGQDAPVLEDPDALGNVMQAVFGGFRPIWEQTQVMAHSP